MTVKKREARPAYLSLKTSRIIAKEGLCQACLERQGIDPGESRQLAVDPLSCSLCRGASFELKRASEAAIKAVGEFEFESFLVGASLPQVILDREDEIRSRYKIRGREGIKTKTTRTISSKISRSLGKKVDYLRPDLTILSSLVDGSISVTPRSVWVFGAYTKSARGVPQRSSICKTCNGVGCANCDYKGSAATSVDLILTSFLKDTFQADACNFIWVGSEDSKSLVYGSGRPFFAEVVRPKKRHLKKLKSGKTQSVTDLGPIKISKLELLQGRPKDVPQFVIECAVYFVKSVQGEPQESNFDIEGISKFENVNVRVHLSRKYRTVTRTIYSISVEKDSENHPFTLRVTCDGGIPIRKLITGDDGTVMPNLSDFIKGYAIDPDQPFDILDIKLSERTRPQPNLGQKRRRRYDRFHNTARREETPQREEIDGEEIPLEGFAGD